MGTTIGVGEGLTSGEARGDAVGLGRRVGDAIGLAVGVELGLTVAEADGLGDEWALQSCEQLLLVSPLSHTPLPHEVPALGVGVALPKLNNELAVESVELGNNVC